MDIQFFEIQFFEIQFFKIQFFENTMKNNEKQWKTMKNNETPWTIQTFFIYFFISSFSLNPPGVLKKSFSVDVREGHPRRTPEKHFSKDLLVNLEKLGFSQKLVFSLF